MNILLAEDEKAMSMAISAVLTHSGYTVDTVQNGAEAVEAAAQKPYDCLIFDIMMPIKDGVTALSEIRQSGNETPAIFLTAKSEVDDRIMGLDAGADDYLTKPFAMGNCCPHPFHDAAPSEGQEDLHNGYAYPLRSVKGTFMYQQCSLIG